MKNLKNFLWLFLVLITVFGVNSSMVSADIIPEVTGEYVQNLPGGSMTSNADLTTSIIPAAIKIIFSLLGIGITGLLIYAGYLHITNFGDEEQVKKANHYLYWAVMGIAFIALSYTLIEAFVHVEW